MFGCFVLQKMHWGVDSGLCYGDILNWGMMFRDSGNIHPHNLPPYSSQHILYLYSYIVQPELYSSCEKSKISHFSKFSLEGPAKLSTVPKGIEALYCLKAKRLGEKQSGTLLSF